MPFVVAIVLLLASSSAPPSAAKADDSALLALLRQDPGLLAELDPLQRRVLDALSPSEARRFARGASTATVFLRTGESLEAFLDRVGALDFSLPWFSVDGGGGTRLRGGDWTLVGALGQPDAGVLIGDRYRLTGGFLAGVRSVDRCRAGGRIFCDGFESGDLSRWLP